MVTMRAAFAMIAVSNKLLSRGCQALNNLDSPDMAGLCDKKAIYVEFIRFHIDTGTTLVYE